MLGTGGIDCGVKYSCAPGSGNTPQVISYPGAQVLRRPHPSPAWVFLIPATP